MLISNLRWVFISTFLATLTMAAGTSTQPASAPTSQPEVRTLIIQSSPVPDPPLKYRLLPQATDMQAGNAAELYLMAFHFQVAGEKFNQRFADDKDLSDQIDEWLEKPMSAEDRATAQKLIDGFSQVLHFAHLAARKEKCVFDPEFLAGQNSLVFCFLRLAKVICLQAHLQIQLGDYEKAATSLQTAYMIVRHLTDNQSFVPALVGLNIARYVNNQTEYWIVTPKSPNLYWALSIFPHPFYDFGKMADRELEATYKLLPFLKPSESTKMTSNQLDELVSTCLIGRLLAEKKMLPVGSDEPDGPLSRAKKNALREKWIIEARLDLPEFGIPKSEIEKMSDLQACGILSSKTFETTWQKHIASASLPYSEIGKIQNHLLDNSNIGRNRDLQAFWSDSVVASLNYKSRFTLGEQRFAVLRSLELLRASRSASTGSMPVMLDGDEILPVPIDPITGARMQYKLEGSTAVLIPGGERVIWKIDLKSNHQK